jgi:hypothetical protein
MKPILTLVKAAHKSFAAHFTKLAEHHAFKAAHHDGLAEHETEIAEAHKAIAGHHKAAGADGLHEEHMKIHKACLGKAQKHEKCAKAEGKHCEHCKAMAAAHTQAEKAVNPDATEGDLVKTLTDGLAEIKAAQGTFPTNDALKELVKGVVKEVVAEQITPDLTKVAGLQLISRDGKTLTPPATASTPATPAADAIII